VSNFLPALPEAPINVNAPGFVTNFANALAACTIIVPEGVAQIGAFAFDYQEVEEVELDAEITDHWLEDNVAAQDHIGVRPTMVTLSGYVAELTMTALQLKTVLGALQAATNSLTALPVFLGHLTPGAAQALEQAISQAQSVVVQVAQSVARAAQIKNLLSGLLNGPALNKQQRAYLQLQAYQQARIIFTVKTPYQVFYNMAIESLRVVRPPDSKEWSKFTVRLKQLNFVGSAQQPNYAANLAAPVALAQGQQPTNVGATAGAAGPTVGAQLAVP
jgi:hypothetical protein